MVKFSLLLMLIAVVLLGFTVVPALSPNNSTVLSLLEPVLCSSGENLIQQVSPRASNVGTSLESFVQNTALFCKPTTGGLTDVTDKLFGIGLTAFLVFLVFGVIFLIIGLIRNGSRGSQPQVITTPMGTSPFYTPQPTVAPANPYATQVSAPRQPSYSNSYPTQAGGYSTQTAVGAPAPSEKFDFDSAATMMSIPKPTAAPAQPVEQPAQPQASAGGSELAKRLKQLRDALDAGLITQEEFDRGKSDLLRDFTDV